MKSITNSVQRYNLFHNKPNKNPKKGCRAARADQTPILYCRSRHPLLSGSSGKKAEENERKREETEGNWRKREKTGNGLLKCRTFAYEMMRRRLGGDEARSSTAARYVPRTPRPTYLVTARAYCRLPPLRSLKCCTIAVAMKLQQGPRNDCDTFDTFSEDSSRVPHTPTRGTRE